MRVRSTHSAFHPFVVPVLALATALATGILGGCGPGAEGRGARPRSAGFAGAARLQTEVASVVDGDTIAVRLAADGGAETTVRLIGIDTPETRKPDNPVECFGPEASERLGELLQVGTPIRLERDTEEFDAYGRLLAYVYRRSDGLFVNQAMVADGFAATLTIAPNGSHSGELTRAAARAREQRRGLWGACTGPHVPR